MLGVDWLPVVGRTARECAIALQIFELNYSPKRQILSLLNLNMSCMCLCEIIMFYVRVMQRKNSNFIFGYVLKLGDRLNLV